MTKTARLRRARSVKNHLGAFVLFQDREIADYLAAERGVNVASAAMSQLLMAQHELGTLIEDLQLEHYGTRK
jgi:hypothetical protein